MKSEEEIKKEIARLQEELLIINSSDAFGESRRNIRMWALKWVVEEEK